MSNKKCNHLKNRLTDSDSWRSFYCSECKQMVWGYELWNSILDKLEEISPSSADERGEQESS